MLVKTLAGFIDERMNHIVLDNSDKQKKLEFEKAEKEKRQAKERKVWEN